MNSAEDDARANWDNRGRRIPLFLATAFSLMGIVSFAEAGDWTVGTVNGHPAQGNASFAFARDGSFSGSTGCNRFSGQGEFESGWLVVSGPVATTRMACPGEALAIQENQLLSIFEHGFSVTYDPFDETLKLTGRKASVVLIPSAADQIPDQKATNSDTAVPNGDVNAAPPVATEDDAPDTPNQEELTLLDSHYVVVAGLSGRLNVRADPSTSAEIVGGVRAGALLTSRGCEVHVDRNWCHIAHVSGGRPQGWVVADYLKPAPAALRATKDMFDGIGTLTCVTADGLANSCDYGVARDSDGTTALTVYLPDSSQQLLVFRGNSILLDEMSDKGDQPAPVVTIIDDQLSVVVGSFEFELPSAVLSPK